MTRRARRREARARGVEQGEVVVGARAVIEARDEATARRDDEPDEVAVARRQAGLGAGARDRPRDGPGGDEAAQVERLAREVVGLLLRDRPLRHGQAAAPVVVAAARAAAAEEDHEREQEQGAHHGEGLSARRGRKPPHHNPTRTSGTAATRSTA